jgi:hypothetical protein
MRLLSKVVISSFTFNFSFCLASRTTSGPNPGVSRPESRPGPLSGLSHACLRAAEAVRVPSQASESTSLTLPCPKAGKRPVVFAIGTTEGPPCYCAKTQSAAPTGYSPDYQPGFALAHHCGRRSSAWARCHQGPELRAEGAGIRHRNLSGMTRIMEEARPSDLDAVRCTGAVDIRTDPADLEMSPGFKTLNFGACCRPMARVPLVKSSQNTSDYALSLCSLLCMNALAANMHKGAHCAEPARQ